MGIEDMGRHCRARILSFKRRLEVGTGAADTEKFEAEIEAKGSAVLVEGTTEGTPAEAAQLEVPAQDG